MVRVALVTALYVLAASEAIQNTDNTSEKWKTLKKEYFLHKVIDQLEKVTALKVTKIQEVPKINKTIQNNTKENHLTPIISDPNYRPSNLSQELDYKCSLDSIDIGFHKLGWNFIISPKTIQYKFCRGSCDQDFVKPLLFTQGVDRVPYVSFINLWLHHRTSLIQRN